MERDVRTHSYATRPFGRKAGPNREAPLNACDRELIRKIWGFLNTFFTKPVIPDLTREFSDLTRAAKVKYPPSHPKLAKTQTRQLTTKPRQADCKTSAHTRTKTQKTHGGQNASKASAARSDDRRAAEHSARQACLRDRRVSNPRARSRATQTSTDVETSKTASPQPCRRRGSADDGQDPRRHRAEYSVATAPRNDVAQPVSRSRAHVKAAASDAVYLDTSEMASDGVLT